MKNPIRDGTVPVRTKYLASLYHTPSELARRLFTVVLRAGRLQAAPDYRIDREHLPGHDLLFCLRGLGEVWCNGRRFRVAPGQVAWISGYYPHGHGAEPSEPWELVWLRADGPTLHETWRHLAVARNPVFTRVRTTAARREFGRVIETITRKTPTLDATLNAAVSEILALLFESRQAEVNPGLTALPGLATDVEPALTRLALYPNRPWRVAELARLCGMSEPHFFRRFKGATGSSPIDFLRRERINHARRRLLQSDDSVAQVAEQVGYADPFYFSRDFKRYTGVSPKLYRRQNVRES